MDQILTHISDILLLIYIVSAVFVCFVIVLQNRDPVRTLSWIIVILMLPFAGLLGYILFGQNYRKRKIFQKKEIQDQFQIESSRVNGDIDESYAAMPASLAPLKRIIQLLRNNNKTRLTSHNEVLILVDGKETFEAIFKACRNARSFIHIESYRLLSDEIGGQLKEILMERASAGVEVRLIYDDVGSWKLKKSYIREMRKAGIQIRPFMPVTFPFLTSKINFRNHRKIVVVDGEKGYVGGLNFAGKYLHGTAKLGPWRDTHMEIRGEAVHSLQRLFVLDWYFVSGEMLTDPEYFRIRAVENNCYIQLAHSGPDSDWASIMQAYFFAITMARKSICISTPYFSPNENVLTALITASMAGTEVRLLLPAKSDSRIAHWSSRSYLKELLDAGVEVYLYEEGFNHSKYMIVDEIMASVGSVNVDYRSFDINFEVTALVYHPAFAAKMMDLFDQDLQKSRQIKLADWEKRSFADKARESLARIFSPLY